MTWRDPRATPLDVIFDWHARRWRVHGPEGDYGLVPTKDEALRLAIDASVTGGAAAGELFRRIHVYDRDDIRLYTITSVKGRLTRSVPQFFQDDVP